MQLPSRSPAPQSSRAQSRFYMLGLSGRASLPALGTSCGSGIPTEELFTQEGLQEQFAKDSTHRSPPNSRSDPNPLAGAVCGVTQKTGLLAEVAPKVWSVPNRQPPGATWAHPRFAGGRGHLGPSRRRRQEAESRARGTMGQEKADGVTKCGVSLHTRHHTHTLC